jgi:hypothetical protein
MKLKELRQVQDVATTIDELRGLCRFRRMNLKSRIKIENRLVAIVAYTEGYSNEEDKDKRKKKFSEAAKLVQDIAAGKVTHDLSALVNSTKLASEGYEHIVNGLDKDIAKLAQQLPVADWMQDEEQRGFGFKSLGIVIGECGDLANYPNPGKLWKRMGPGSVHKERQDPGRIHLARRKGR